MTSASSPGPRVLAVDDSAEMRAIIGRVLGRAGYRVDLAATLGEARKLEPAGYDAVLVDARLGTDLGTDLLDDLAAADPGMLRCCLVVTGGSDISIPAGVATLKKPFQLGDLLTAVRALHEPAAPAGATNGTGPDQHQPEVSGEPVGAVTGHGEAGRPPELSEAPEASEAPEVERVSEADGVLEAGGVPEAHEISGPNGATPPGPRNGHSREPTARPGGEWGNTVPAGPGTWRLLSLARRLRARERAGVADFLHDGPIQDLAAASLELQLLRRSASSAQAAQLDAVLRRLEAVARPLRTVVDEAVPALVTQPQLAHALEQRAGWLGTPLAVAANAECAELTAAEVDAAVDVAELMLLAMTPGLPPAQAEAEVQVADGLIGIALALVPAAAEVADGDRTIAYQALRELAAALAITLGSEFGRWRWRAWTTVPRTAPPWTAPPSTAPPSTVPAITVPAATVPAATVPATTVPATTVPAGQGNGMARATLPGASPSQELPDQALPRPRRLNAVTWP